MASVSWENKYKGATESKAHFRHNEKDERYRTKVHKNSHIDKSKTYLNFSVIGRSYGERCEMYDKAVEDYEKNHVTIETYEIKSGRGKGKTCTRKKGGLRKDAVTCVGLEVPVPKDLPRNKMHDWFLDVHNLICDVVGEENVIDSDCHFDETHEYYDPDEKEWVMSREHMHTNFLPITSDGRFCCKEICNIKNITKLNNAIEKMSREKYGVKFMTGEKKTRNKSVEELKNISREAQEKLVREAEREKTKAINVKKHYEALISKEEKHITEEAMKQVNHMMESFDNNNSDYGLLTKISDTLLLKSTMDKANEAAKPNRDRIQELYTMFEDDVINPVSPLESFIDEDDKISPDNDYGS